MTHHNACVRLASNSTLNRRLQQCNHCVHIVNFPVHGKILFHFIIQGRPIHMKLFTTNFYASGPQLQDWLNRDHVPVQLLKSSGVRGREYLL